ncbi:MAG: cytosine deaminase [Alphaproteobacteria bacterium]
MKTLIKNAKLQNQKELVDIAINDGVIATIESGITGDFDNTIDAGGNIVVPPFVDSHFHLDSVLNLGNPRLNESGTLLEGIQIWNEYKNTLDFTAENILKRAKEYCGWAISQGILAIRSHVDVCDDRLIGVDALLQLKKEMAEYIDIQLVAFPQDGYYRDPNAIDNLNKALDKGIDVVGGIPHAERTMAEGSESVKALMQIAEKRGLLVDMHCDETDDVNSRHIETLTAETIRLGMNGRVAGSHVTAMHGYDNYYFEKLKGLMATADMNIVTNPLINITLQGRFDTYPKRRGLARIPELNDAGINVTMAQDCVMDPWYNAGKADMFEVLLMGSHVAHMNAPSQIEQCFDMITKNPAKVMGIEKYGIEKGCNGDLVILNADSIFEAVRLKAERLFVIRRGKVVATSQPSKTTLDIAGEKHIIDFKRKNVK